MPPAPPSQQMGEKHEIYLAQINAGTKTTSSGNQWDDQGDGRNHHDDPFAFCWDGKSTKSKSLTVTLAMIEKIREQAQGERPQIGLRWYSSDVLDVAEDWVAVPGADWEEVLSAARRAAQLEAELETYKAQVASITMLQEEALAAQAVAQEALDLTRAQLAAQARPAGQASFGGATGGPGGGGGGQGGGGAGSSTGSGAGGGGGGGRMTPEYVPMLPWTIIYQEHAPGRVYLTGEYYDRSGYRCQIIVDTVVVERSHGAGNRPRLIVNGVRVPHGSLYVDGHLTTRAAETNPDIEVG